MKRAFVFALLGGILPIDACSTTNVRSAPPPPAPTSEEIQIVYLAKAGPVLLHVHMQTEGPRPTARWAEHLREWFAFLDRDGDGKLSPDAFRRAPSPGQIRRQWQSGLYPPLGEPGADFRTADVDGDHFVSSTEFAAYYRAGGVGPYHVVLSSDDSPTQAALTATLFGLIDRDRDGMISRAELLQTAASLRRLDPNDDELLTPEEILPKPAPVRITRPSAAPELLVFTAGESAGIEAAQDAVLSAALLRHYDRDGDRHLSATEMRLSPTRFRKLDVDRNGRLIGEEASALRRSEADAEFGVRLSSAGNRFRQIGPGQPGEAETLRATLSDVLLLARAAPTQPLLGSGVRQLFRQQFLAADRDRRGAVALDTLDSNRFRSLDALASLADRDGDGRLTEAELVRCVDLYAHSLDSHVTLTVSANRAGLFDLLDIDRDGRLSPRELATAADRLLTWDHNRDGRLAPEELPISFEVVFSEGPADRRELAVTTPAAGPRSLNGPDWFHLLDRNGDGDISRREFVGNDEEFRRLDRDGDGLISLAEAEAAAVRFRKQTP